MSFLARLSLANRVLVVLVSLVITGFGVFAVPGLKQQLFPSLEFPAAFIAAPYQGASPEIIEQQVTAPIEDAIRGVDGIEELTSTSTDGVATITAMFEFGTDIDGAVNQLQTAINRIQSQLPDDVEPTVFAGGTDDIPAIVLAASAGGDQQQLARRLEDEVLPRLRAIEGVRDAAVSGARSEQIVVTPDPAKLAAAGVQPQAIGAALQANGVSIPAGSVTEGPRSLTVQVGTPITTVEQLGDVYLPGRAGPVQLDSVATVAAQESPATSYTRTNGQASLGLTVTAAPDGNAVTISHEVRDQLAELETAAGAELTVISDQAPFVERSIEALTTEGLLGLVMAVIVILVFLLSLRSTLVTAVSIPLSVVVALIALYVGDYSLNLLTLGALTIAVGRVVDDSIVVLENIKRHLEYGEERSAAILTAVREVAGAVTASTLTTVAVFAPIALVGGFVGQLFSPFAITVTVALLASLLVSLTVIPVLAYWFLRPSNPGADGETARRLAEEKELRSPLQRAYLPVIRFATQRRVATLLIGVLVLLGTGALATRLETNFIDQSGQDTLSISQQMPVGASLAVTDAAARQVEQVVAARPDVESYQVTVGSGEFNPFAGGGGSNSATFSIALRDGVDALVAERELRTQVDALGDAAGEITVGAGQGGGGFNANQLAVVVRAADPEVLRSATAQVREAMTGVADVTDVTDNLAASSPTVQVQVDRAAAARAGLTEAQIGQTVAGAFRGQPLGRLTGEDTRRDVILRLGQAPADVAAVRALPLAGGARPVTVDDVADVTEVNGPVEITRIDGDRSATVTGTATGSNVGAATRELTTKLTALTLPAGASYEIGGVSAEQAEAFGDLGIALLAAIAIVFIIMVATFHSFAQPLVLLVSIPFAATGAIGLLLATGTALGVPALIGMLMLVGIVVTNAIVLMDLINQYRKQGMGVTEAVVEGGRRRLRPILMTAVATIFALVPMALGLTGEGGFISQPLAVVVIGGLISSTLLTLVLVPTLYTMVETRKDRSRERRAARRLRKAGGAPAAATEATETAAEEPAPVAEDPTPPNVAAGEPEPEPKPEPASRALRGYTDQFEVLRLPRNKPSTS
ncbi:efflux RND transporter permease subunit [Spirilliplanes yamanashiensis]|uniref:Hydrogenase expression protein n=1 Tax=Spirilliplanes yamanashiensis TaxID=42233 RepID=A0A8J3Y3X5_9ACTN|nr:efflux RND transporter permease subunit [Spirilliplanes yamanashiensis]MDP9819945.1 HAE1 family hydrophobic/amphiphilic exporter-1 [Spirilliplanes yamanashiensis]GIJ01236.1 hydrogenase expression protein [Spirilliplanes yamanashiensis]